MAKDVKTRIEERNRAAEFHRKDQGVIGRTISGAGLAIANTWDRISSPFKKDGMIFTGSAISGAMHGAVLGGLAGIAGILLTLGTAAAPFAVPIFAVAAIGGALIGGAKRGQERLEENWNKSNRQFADRVAEKTGAVPGQMKFAGDVGATPEQELKRSGHDPKLLERADEVIERNRSFVKDEEMRRKNRGPIVLN